VRRRVGPRRRLSDDTIVDHLLVRLGVIDLMAERRVGDDDRLEPFLEKLVPNDDEIRDERGSALGRVSDVRAVDEDDVARLFAIGVLRLLRLLAHAH